MLTTREAARLIDAHESSVKRWCDSGALECTLTAGGHRRIEIGSLVAFAEREDLAVPIRSFGARAGQVLEATRRSIRVRDDAELVDITYDLAVGRSGHLLTELVHFLHMSGFSVEQMFDRVIAPTVRKVGIEWSTGCLSVGREHVITQVLLDLLFEVRRELSPLPASMHRPRALVGCAEGNRHDLGAQMVRSALDLSGWDVVYLGGDVPTEEFAALQQGLAVGLVCISFVPPQVPSDVTRALNSLGSLYNPAVPYHLVVGGSASEGFEPPAETAPFLDVRAFHQIESFVAWTRDSLGPASNV